MENEQSGTNDRISIRPDVLVGKPVIKGTRIPVSLIQNLVAYGYDIEQVIEDYPILTKEDVAAALAYPSVLPT